MLTTSIAKEKQLPVNFSSQTETNQDVVVRELVIETEEGVISEYGQRVSTMDAKDLAAWVGSNSTATYVVDTQDHISTQALVTVLDRLREAGATRLMVKED